MKRWIIIVAAVVVAGAGTAYVVTSRRESSAPTYRFVTVDRGAIDSVVSATGTLSAVTTVQVGTQVSGLISKLFVDFNDKVTKDQVIAQLDTTLLESNLRDAEATLERSKADLWKAKQDLARLETLHQQGIAADSDYNTAQYNAQVAEASVKSSEATLARAKQNLGYATIKAPVSGTVVERDVDVGQTVASSLATPKLFVIANDLSEMQILAAVDESDIGQIKEGQTARFTVKAYPDRKFDGTVKQVRLQSTVDQNIVDYTVAISVKNSDGKLLPGMTATVEFVTANATDVFKVANAALRFRPPDAVAAKVRERLQKEMAARMAAGQQGGEHAPVTAEGTPGQGQAAQGNEERRAGQAGGAAANGSAVGGPPNGAFPAGGFPGANGGANGHGPRNMTLLYYLDEKGELTARPVHAGITDGQFTEIKGRDLQVGMKVIASMSSTAPTTSGNPFQPAAQPSGPGRPPGGF
jgi:HlyD family secretion protein